MRLAVLMPLLALAACATAQPDRVIAEPGGTEPAAACRGESLAQFVGQVQSEALGKRMLAASGARAIRWVEKDMMVTMEFRADRITVYLDAAKKVERANCG